MTLPMRSSGIRQSFLRSAIAGAVFVAALGITTAEGLQAQQSRPRVLRGVTRDSATGVPVAGALVQVRADSVFRTERSDDAGNFRFSLPSATYRVTVLRIGYAERVMSFALGDRDTSLIIPMRSVATALDASRIVAGVPAIYGVVARLPDLLPIAGATVHVMGATKTVATDSAGRFFIDVGRPGNYLVRMTRDGFGEMLFPVEVPPARAVEASRMLEPSTRKPVPGMEHLFVAVDERLRSKGYNAALIPASELKASGGATLLEALPGARSMTLKGLRVGGGACIYLNGHTTSMPLEAIDVNEVEAVEVYAGRGDVTATLKWLGCRSTTRGGRGSGVARSPEMVTSIVIWLKR
jgi:hypothetical protein